MQAASCSDDICLELMTIEIAHIEEIIPKNDNDDN